MTDNHGHDHHRAGHDHAGHDHAGHGLPESMDDLLELDAAVLHGYWTAALDWVREAAAPLSPARLLDLGAGTGTGALGLAERFPGATVTAVDVEHDALERLRGKAKERGLADRVHAVEADLDTTWPDLGPLDLTWASMSLHHLADPGAALREALAVTRPGGMIAVAEFPEPLRFLPDDLGTGPAGFEDRVLVPVNAAHVEVMPTLGSAWAPRLADAGWNVTAERAFPIDLDPPTHPDAGRYAQIWFSRLARGFADRIEPGDRATLAALLDEHGPHSLLHRSDLHIRGTRIVTLARRD
jgi:ubiquinone/menaquinone biosynthesis C-methylase UbiE